MYFTNLIAFFVFNLFTLVNTVDPIDTTAGLLKDGNIQELAKTFSSSVDLTVNGDENVYSKSQAEIILRNFFQKHQPKAVKVLHRVTSNPNYRFAVLILTTSDGTYRVSVSLKSANGLFVLEELRIEAEKTN
jgi:hypothetical protein